MEGEEEMTAELAIQTKSLVKKYQNNAAVNGLDLEVYRGSIYGFLGLNGAGKTTTIKMLLNLVYPTAGEGMVLGHDIVRDTLKIREKVGFVAEDPTFYEYMKVSEILDFCRNSYARWDSVLVGKYLDLFGIAVSNKVKGLSKGMRGILALVMALGVNSELLILDEPTVGLDPAKTREFFRVIMEQVVETGQTVFFSSHRLNEVERIADSIGILHQGKLVFSSSIDDIKANYKKIRVVFGESKPPAALAKIQGVKSVRALGRGYILETEEGCERIIPKLNELEPVDVEIIDVNLEDVFMQYTGGGYCGQ